MPRLRANGPDDSNQSNNIRATEAEKPAATEHLKGENLPPAPDISSDTAVEVVQKVQAPAISKPQKETASRGFSALHGRQLNTETLIAELHFHDDPTSQSLELFYEAYLQDRYTELKLIEDKLDQEGLSDKQRAELLQERNRLRALHEAEDHEYINVVSHAVTNNHAHPCNQPSLNDPGLSEDFKRSIVMLNRRLNSVKDQVPCLLLNPVNAIGRDPEGALSGQLNNLVVYSASLDAEPLSREVVLSSLAETFKSSGLKVYVDPEFKNFIVETRDQHLVMLQMADFDPNLDHQEFYVGKQTNSRRFSSIPLSQIGHSQNHGDFIKLEKSRIDGGGTQELHFNRLTLEQENPWLGSRKNKTFI